MRDAHGWIRMHWTDKKRRYSFPDPTNGIASQAAWKCRYAKDALTQADCFRMAEVYEAYHHLLTHPAGTESVVKQLRAVRRALAAPTPSTEKDGGK